MIGIICHEPQRPFVKEFFELFKTPWEFFRATGAYDVVLITASTPVIPDARLVVAFGACRYPWDVDCVVEMPAEGRSIRVDHGEHQFPVYGRAARLEASPSPLATVAGGAGVVIAEYRDCARRLVRVGYDLFEEVRLLLCEGQPAEHATIPTLDVHIDLLRGWILRAELPMLEIPNRPGACDFAVCLTHDVDFINMRDHINDRSVLGFIARALIPRNLRNARSQFVWSRLWKNWAAVLSLPAVYLRLCRDIWFDIDRYAEIERGLEPTYFFLPRKDHPGEAAPGAGPVSRAAPALRAARYNVGEHASLLADLKNGGAEIAIHGIDAWHSAQHARTERTLIGSVAAAEPAGVRVHWLYFSPSSPQHLERAGFSYDSTLGFNEAVGFRSGTTQVFRLPGTAGLLELPLNIMDSALFYRGRMGLSERDALTACGDLIDTMKKYGGALTINWHTRSLNPERNWDSFYLELLSLLKAHRVWFANARTVVEWFRGRRAIRFEEVSGSSARVKVACTATGESDSLAEGYTLRIYRPGTAGSHAVSDIPLSGQEITVTF
jgi:hypothetical protein